MRKKKEKVKKKNKTAKEKSFKWRNLVHTHSLAQNPENVVAVMDSFRECFFTCGTILYSSFLKEIQKAFIFLISIKNEN